MKANIQKALDRYSNGEQYSTSTSIDEETILAGYGKLEYDDFEFPLPQSVIEKEFGATTWSEYFDNKGYHRWRTVHKTNGKTSILGRYSEQEVEEMKLIEGNENYNFEKI